MILDKEAVQVGLMPLTIWEERFKAFDSQYGHVYYETWCARECERLNKNPQIVAKLVHETDEGGNLTGRICIYRNPWMKRPEFR